MLIKSPMNYTGGKFKLLPQIMPLFPKEIDTFVDLFAGGLNVAINVGANKIIANEICEPIIDIYQNIKNIGALESYNKIISLIDEYSLSKTNTEGYLKLRDYYNKENRSWEVLYTLILYSFNNQFRFNKKNEFNMPFGKNRSSFNPSLQNKFKIFATALENKNIEFSNKSFIDFDYTNLSSKDLVYLDPPYLLGCASYNENGGWTKEMEVELLKYCDKLNNHGVKFALSNVLLHKGQEHTLLKNWSKKYNIHYLSYDYNNCNYQANNQEFDTLEVLITNY